MEEEEEEEEEEDQNLNEKFDEHFRGCSKTSSWASSPIRGSDYFYRLL